MEGMGCLEFPHGMSGMSGITSLRVKVSPWAPAACRILSRGTLGITWKTQQGSLGILGINPQKKNSQKPQGIWVSPSQQPQGFGIRTSQNPQEIWISSHNPQEIWISSQKYQGTWISSHKNPKESGSHLVALPKADPAGIPSSWMLAGIWEAHPGSEELLQHRPANGFGVKTSPKNPNFHPGLDPGLELLIPKVFPNSEHSRIPIWVEFSDPKGFSQP